MDEEDDVEQVITACVTAGSRLSDSTSGSGSPGDPADHRRPCPWTCRWAVPLSCTWRTTSQEPDSIPASSVYLVAVGDAQTIWESR